MRTDGTITGLPLLAALEDLLRLDHDAVAGYTAAIEAMDDARYAEPLLRFRADHERHIVALTQLIRAHGGDPDQSPHATSGPLKLALQQAAGTGGVREILLAFKSNEGQVREKYHRHASRRYPDEVMEVVRRNAADEDRHYEWVSGALEELGAGAGTMTGRAQRAFEAVHGTAADVAESIESGPDVPADVGAVSGVRDGIRRTVRQVPLASVATVVGVGMLLRRLRR